MKNTQHLDSVKTTIAVKAMSLKKRRRAITRLADWVARIKGWLCARKGKNACDAEIARLQQRCFAVEHSMCDELEQSILQLHVDSSLFWLKSSNIEKRPEIPAPGADPIALRSSAAAKNRYEASESAAKSAKQSIVRIHEMLISAEHCFYQNVEHLRAYTSAKIDAFTTGVRSNKKAQLTDYRVNEPVIFDGTAYSDYKHVHEANDHIRADFLE